MKKLTPKSSLWIVTVLTVAMSGFLFIIGDGGFIKEGSDFYHNYLPLLQAIGKDGIIFKRDVALSTFANPDRDILFSEFKLAGILFMTLPLGSAMSLLYLLKIMIAVFGALSLNRVVYKENCIESVSMAIFFGFILANVGINPYFALSLSSLPYLLSLLLQNDKKIKITTVISILIYPIMSDFIHIGIYILVLYLIIILVCSIKNRRFEGRKLLGLGVLLTGYVITEYRLLICIINKIIDGEHPVGDNILFSYSGRESLLTQLCLLLMFPVMVLIFVALRKLINGKLFNGKIFEGRKKIVVEVLMIAFCVAMMIAPTNYNYLTLGIFRGDNVYHFDKYCSKELLEKVKEDINYKNQWAATYGLPSDILVYSDIRNVERVSVYDDIDLRVERSLLDKALPGRVEGLYSSALEFDLDALKDSYARLLFSGLELSDTETAGLEFLGKYENDNSPFDIFVYKTDSRYKDKLHKKVPFEERNLELDYAKIDELSQKLKDILDTINDFTDSHKDLSDADVVKQLDMEQQIFDWYDELYEVYCLFDSKYVIENINYNKNVNNEASALASQEAFDKVYDLYYDIIYGLRDLSLTPYHLVLEKKFDESQVKAFIDFEDVSEEVKQSQMKETELGNKYLSCMGDYYSVEYEGQVWDEDRLMEDSDNLEDSEFIDILNQIYKKKGEAVFDIFSQLREERLKDGDFINKSYKNTYNRDYTEEDVEELINEVHKSYQDIIRIEKMLFNIYDLNPGYIYDDGRQIYEQLKPVVTEIDPELGTSMQYLLDYNLFDLYPSNTKSNQGFSITIPYYGDAYIFDSPTMTEADLYTFVHEFGHYNAFFNDTTYVFETYNNADVNELQSQGLEMLMASKYDDILGEDLGKFYEVYGVNKMCTDILSACRIAEFELYIYKHPKADLEELSKAYNTIGKKYGYEDVSCYDKDGDYSWVTITHLFEAPLQYISYATSAIAALELYVESYEDYDLAAEKYMEISCVGGNVKLNAACDRAGLGRIFDKGNASEMFRKTADILTEKYHIDISNF